jgi:hypothetical protein
MIAETNNVIALGGTFANVIVGDVLKQSSTVRGTVSFANTSYVVIKHTSGTWATGTTVYKALDNTIANATITSVTTLHTPIDSGVLSYWTPVSLYDHEHEENEKKKHIRLLSADYLDLVERDMKELLAT